MRFNNKLTTHAEVHQYYIDRAIYLLYQGFALNSLENREWGVVARLSVGENLFKSAFVLPAYSGKGIYSQWLKEEPEIQLLTMESCGEIAKYVDTHKSSSFLNDTTFACEPGSLPFARSYDVVEKFSGSRKAKRSGLYYMNHIDEGLFILDYLYGKHYQVSEYILGAWCFHPMVQRDEDLANNYKTSYYVGPFDVLYAMEYRRVANNYLSFHTDRAVKDIELSPLEAVNQMLVADKIQNRKEFDNYLRGKVENSKQLNRYFANWFERLEITEDKYNEIATMIQTRTGRNHIVLD